MQQLRRPPLGHVDVLARAPWRLLDERLLEVLRLLSVRVHVRRQVLVLRRWAHAVQVPLPEVRLLGPCSSNPGSSSPVRRLRRSWP